MELQARLFETVVDPKDIVFTPDYVAKQIIRELQPEGKCLDPCKGDGAFLKYLPDGSDYCEIREGKDFLSYKEKVDWVIGNPPYSIFEDFLKKGFEISENVSYLVPTNKVFQRQLIMNLINKYGGIKNIIIYGGGANYRFPFRFFSWEFSFQKRLQRRNKNYNGYKINF